MLSFISFEYKSVILLSFSSGNYIYAKCRDNLDIHLPLLILPSIIVDNLGTRTKSFVFYVNNVPY